MTNDTKYLSIHGINTKNSYFSYEPEIYAGNCWKIMRETKLVGIPMSVKLLTIYKLGKDGNIIIFSSISLQS